MDGLIGLRGHEYTVADERTFELQAGEVLVMTCTGDAACVLGQRLEARQTLVACGPCVLDACGDGLEWALAYGVPDADWPVDLAGESFYSNTFIFMRGLENACQLTDGPDLFMVSSVVLQFLSHWRRRVDVRSGLAQRAADWIEAHCQENVTARQLSEVLGYSPWYIMHCFSDAFSMSVHSYLMRCRMVKVKEAISRKEKSLEEIALDNGFSSRSSMHKAFVRVYGITPGQFQRFMERNEKS